MKNKLLILLALVFLHQAQAMLPGDEDRYQSEQQGKLYRPFYYYCISEGHKINSLDKIEALVAAGCDINAYYGKDTALTHRAKVGPARVYELLIRLGADLNLPNKDTGDTPLILAFSSSHYQLCELLIKSGADINARNHLNRTALFYAVSRHQRELTQLLLEHGACLADCAQDGSTPLIWAATRRSEPLCELFLSWPKQMNARIIALLCCLKSIGTQNRQLKFLYNERSILLRPHLAKFTLSLQKILRAKDAAGKTAYDYWQVDWLRSQEYV